MTTNFTLRQLEYAVAAARSRSFGEAARCCHVSQPSLSAQLGQLETALGRKLFERTSKGVALTAFGSLWIAEARALVERAQALADLARAEDEPLSGELRLGIIPTIAPFALPAALPHLHARYPQCSVMLVEDETERLLEQLHDGLLDVLVLALEAELGAVTTLPVFRDPLLAALPAGHPLASRPRISLIELPRDELLLLHEGHCLSRQVESLCTLPNERDDFRASSLVTLVQMVAMNAGVTLLPLIAANSELVGGSNIVLAEIVEQPFRTIGLAWRPHCPRAAEFEILAGLLEAAAPAE
ncbi:MAG: LysR family transcriptional regulator [Planctomycetes bacterium]|nr:LysR family transcriptional regulator [Planctomycetota bacterium]